MDLQFFNADTGIAIGDNKIFKSFTGGISWNELAVYPSYDLINIYFYDNHLGYIVCEPRRILKTTDSGNSWNEIIVDSTLSFNSLFLKNETTGWASVSEGFMVGGSIFKTTDAGETWSAFPIDNFKRLYHFSTTTIGRVRGYPESSISTNVIVQTDNGGNSWTTEDSTYGNFYHDWFFVNDSLGWLVGSDGVIRHLNSTDNIIDTNDVSEIIPKEFLLSQNYPNPFNPSTKIKFTIPVADNPLRGGARGGFVTLKVYDLLGKEVATLVNEEKPAGEYEVEFKAVSFPSGIYFYQLKAGQYSKTKK